jgi:hypothetical protein
MRRSPFLLMAGIVAFVRVFVLGVAAVSLGMTDYGGVSSALLRIFQVYDLFFVYIVMLQYFKPAAREFLRMPSLVVTGASCVLSALALFAFVHASRASFPADFVRTGGSMLGLLLLDVVVLGLLALDALRRQVSVEEKPTSGHKAHGEQSQAHNNIEDDTTHEVQ